MRFEHRKHDEPGLKEGQVCIGYIQGTSVEPLGWETKVAGVTKERDGVLCTAIIVDRAEMLERGYRKEKNFFVRER